MQLIQEMTVKSSRGGSEKDELFKKVDDAVFCKSCGRQYKINEIENKDCIFCGESAFLTDEFASTLAGYIRLNNIGRLKEYYKQRTKKTGKTMNVRRLVIWMLIDDCLMKPGDKKTEEFVYKTLWKKW